MLHRGTKAMIRQMLRDLGLPATAFDDWSLDHLASNFLTKGRPSSHWRDVWLDTWTLSVGMAKPDNFEVADLAPVSSEAPDASWDGRSIGIPAVCMVVADFYDAWTIARGKVALNWIRQPDGDPSLIETILKESPKIPRRELVEVRTAFEQRMRDRPDATNWFTVKSHPGHRRRLLAEMASDLRFFEEGAKLARAVSVLCEAIGGTTRWSERAKRLKRARRPSD